MILLGLVTLAAVVSYYGYGIYATVPVHRVRGNIIARNDERGAKFSGAVTDFSYNLWWDNGPSGDCDGAACSGQVGAVYPLPTDPVMSFGPGTIPR